MKILRVALLFCFPLLGCATVTSTTDKIGPFLITSLPQDIPTTNLPFVSSSQLLVLDTGTTGVPRDPAAVLTLGSDYTVTGGNYNGSNQMQTGTVRILSGGAHSVIAGDYIVILRNVPLNQTSSFTTTGPNTVLILEQMGDKLATLSQQVNEIGSRSLQFENFEFLSGTLQKDLRSGCFIAFDANGDLEFIPNTIDPISPTFTDLTVTGTTDLNILNVSGALTATATDNFFGPGGLGSAVATVYVSGGSSGVGGSRIGLLKNGSVVGYFGTASSAGGSGGSDNTAIYVPSSSNAFDVYVNATTAGHFTDTGFSTPAATISSGNLTFSATGQRIKGDLSNATVANRLFVQTSIADSVTSFGAIPNGTSQQAVFAVFNNSTPTNAAFVQLGITNTTANINSAHSGSGTTMPLEVQIDGTAQLTIKTSGVVNLTTITNYASNAAAISGGLVAGDLYRNGDNLCIVH